MGDKTSISWTDATWNPVRGCSRVSEGCRHCYAERVAARFSDPGMPYHGLAQRVVREVRQIKLVNGRTTGDFRTISRTEARWTGEVRMVPEHLADPLRWKKPRRIFVNSMSDLFHEKLADEDIAAVFGVMAAAPQHTFQILTKRAKRMREWFDWARGPFADQQRGIARAPNVSQAMLDAAAEYLSTKHDGLNAAWRRLEDESWPLPNVWLGVSVENQDAANERIPELIRVPAVSHFLSCEPLLGPLDLEAIHGESIASFNPAWLNWLIAGCESGPGARPASVDWYRSLRDHCAAAGVAFFLKQATFDCDVDGNGIHDGAGSKFKGANVGRHSPSGLAGNLIELPYLDGVQHAAFPEIRP